MTSPREQECPGSTIPELDGGSYELDASSGYFEWVPNSVKATAEPPAATTSPVASTEPGEGEEARLRKRVEAELKLREDAEKKARRLVDKQSRMLNLGDQLANLAADPTTDPEALLSAVLRWRDEARSPAPDENGVTVDRADLEAAAAALQAIYDEFADTPSGPKTYGPPEKALTRIHRVSRPALVRLRAALSEGEESK